MKNILTYFSYLDFTEVQRDIQNDHTKRRSVGEPKTFEQVQGGTLNDQTMQTDRPS